MGDVKMRCCVFPGSFDPFTCGHLNIVERALKIFDKVTVLVCVNSGKGPRFIGIEKTLEGINNTLLACNLSDRVKVDILKVNQSVLDYMSNHREELDNCMNIIRGVRNVEDISYEMNLYGQYRYFSHDIRFEFIPIIAEPKYAYLSSSVAREAIRLKCINETAEMVPFPVLETVYNP